MERPNSVTDSVVDPQEFGPRPSVPWVRWLVAGLVLIVLAFVFHTSGHWARTVKNATRRWMSVSTSIPKALENPAQSLLNRPSKTAAASPWLPPVAHARVVSAFGWHGSGSTAKFQPDLILQAAAKSSVIAGVTGRVAATGPHQVTLSAAGYHIRFSPIQASVKKHQMVGPTTRLGTAAGAQLTIQVTRAGYPLNPLSRGLYGSAWIGH